VEEVMPIAILWPTFALVALIYTVWIILFVARTGHMRRSPPPPGALEGSDTALRYFRPVEMPANNLANLFEMPVLYFALVPLLLITRHGDHVQVALAWAFVALRALHSLIHIGPKKVIPRFVAYLGSCIVLSAMWIGFAIDMIGAARA
jgi:hypothetical protein